MLFLNIRYLEQSQRLLASALSQSDRHEILVEYFHARHFNRFAQRTGEDFSVEKRAS